MRSQLPSRRSPKSGLLAVDGPRTKWRCFLLCSATAQLHRRAVTQHSGATMQRNVLPGKQEPYYLGSGEGHRYLLGPFLATIIGRRQDTGSLMDGVVLIGAKNSVMPLHRHNNSHEAMYVL